MQLTAREWIELIADPEIREKALANMNNTKTLREDKISAPVHNIPDALEYAFWWYLTPEGSNYWGNVCYNPPALLPFPNKEREQAEALLMEFAVWFTEAGHEIQAYDSCAFLSEKNVTDFLNQKYPS